MAIETIVVPDLGGAESVDVIELSLAQGDTVGVEDSLLVLESDKATMDVPSPHEGQLVKYLVAEGDTVKVGDPIAELEIQADPIGAAAELRVVEHEIEHLREGERHHDEVDALHAHDEHADDERRRARREHRRSDHHGSHSKITCYLTFGRNGGDLGGERCRTIDHHVVPREYVARRASSSASIEALYCV